jgi:hypothetical protein
VNLRYKKAAVTDVNKQLYYIDAPSKILVTKEVVNLVKLELAETVIPTSFLVIDLDDLDAILGHGVVS